MLTNARLTDQLNRVTIDMLYADLGCLIVYTGTGVFDANNNEVKTVTEVTVPCSFSDKPTREIWKDYADFETFDAEVRIQNTEPGKDSKFRLLRRFGKVVTERTYEVAGVTDRANFGYVVALRAVRI